MARLTSMSFVLLAIVVAAMVSLGCGGNTSSEGEYSGVVAALEGDPTEGLADPVNPLPDEPVELGEYSEPVPAPGPIGTVAGTGTNFAVTDSEYLNVTLVSTEPIQLALESVPQVVTLMIEAAEGAAATQLTLTGFEPTTTYYRYTEDYESFEEVMTDASGTLVFTQDLSEPHLVTIQTTTSTISLSASGWSRQDIGAWDPTTLTGTLETDVTEMIVISSDGITLDGAGHTVTGSGPGSSVRGIYLSGRTGVTVKNIDVQGFTYGIYLYGSDDNAVIDNIVSNNDTGVYLARSRFTTVSGNTVSSNRTGINLFNFSSGNTLVENTIAANTSSGIYVYYWSRVNTIADNTVSSNGNGIYLNREVSSNTVSGNTVTDSASKSIFLEDCDHCIADGNYVSGGGYLHLRRSFYGTVSNNDLNDSGIHIDNAYYNSVTNNRGVAHSGGGIGIYLLYSADNLISGNTVSQYSYGIYIAGIYQDRGDRNTVTNNQATQNGYGMRIETQDNVVADNVCLGNGPNAGMLIAGYRNLVTGNRISDNAERGLRLRGEQSIVSGNTVMNNGTYGLFIQGCGGNTVSNNTFSGNRTGVYIYFSNDNSLYENRISGNTDYWGMIMSGYDSGNPCTTTPRNNSVYNNDFIDNYPGHLGLWTSGRAEINSLNQAPPTGGNYWSGYTTPDIDEDGFVDVPYRVEGPATGSVEVDYYPWASPLGVGADNEGPVTSDVTVRPSVVEVGGTVTLTATVDDTNTGGSNIASAEYILDGGETWNAMGGTWDDPIVVVDSSFVAPATAGVYEVCVRGTDALDNVGEQECTFLVAYDPSGGFVTGGGWIDSPAGAYGPDPTLIGKANFGFVSKYKKGASVPTGNTEFQFKAGDMNFKSTSYDWLVIAGSKAKFKGEGTINGDGNYGFMLSATDGDLKNDGDDTFRIKIWDKDDADTVVYDNQMGDGEDADAATTLGGGSIVIHKAK